MASVYPDISDLKNEGENAFYFERQDQYSSPRPSSIYSQELQYGMHTSSAQDVQASNNLGNSNSARKSRKLFSIKECEYQLDPLNSFNKPGINQWILYGLPFDYKIDKIPNPYPKFNSVNIKTYQYWEINHVKMPYHESNRREVKNPLWNINQFSNVCTWKLVEKALGKSFTSYKEIESAIKSYNNYENYEFDVLRTIIKTNSFTNALEVINFMRELTIKLPEIVTQSPPMLRQGRESILFLSQKQIACLLANAFFCTFPRRSRQNSEYKTYPLFNFVTQNDSKTLNLKKEKLHCILNYFNRIKTEDPNGVVSFHRKCSTANPDWATINNTIRDIQVESEGSIEVEGRVYAEIDFANKLVGGGVLNNGSLQEELRFLISPELIVSRLFTEALREDEALVINGTVQYNRLNINGTTFTFDGNEREKIIRDDWGRHYSQVIAIDAQDFTSKDKQEQFKLSAINRALNKAYIGFRDESVYKNGAIPTIATGKWGCGGFNGDPYFSCVIQYVAASYAKRDLLFFTKNDRSLEKAIIEMTEICSKQNLKIKDMYRALISYQNISPNQTKSTNIIEFIIEKFSKNLIDF